MEATAAARQMYREEPQENTVADAFRHAWGNILMCKRIGQDFAREFGAAHETIAGSAHSHQMDAHNNERGIAIFGRFPSHSEDELMQDLVSHVRDHPYTYFSEGNVPQTESLIYFEPAPPVPSPTSVVVEVSQTASSADGVGFHKGGTPRYWWSGQPYGRNRNMLYTFTNGRIKDNVGTWRPNISVAGRYEVKAYIPSYFASTKHADYEVHSAEGTSRVSVDQYRISNAWASLGTFRFEAGTGGYVQLSDQTGEALKAAWIGFDSLEFSPR